MARQDVLFSFEGQITSLAAGHIIIIPPHVDQHITRPSENSGLVIKQITDKHEFLCYR